MADLAVIEPESVSPDLLKTIDDVKTKAEAGEVSSVAIALVYRDGSTSYTYSSPPTFATLLGAVHMLAYCKCRKKDAE